MMTPGGDTDTAAERLYSALFEVVKADALARPDEGAESTLNAVAWLLIDLSEKLGVSPQVVIENLAKMLGCRTERIPLVLPSDEPAS